MDPKFLQAALPVLIVVVAMAFRLRRMARPQPLKSERMWIVPAILVLLGGFTLFANPPTITGWAICLSTLVVGAVLGWHRGKLTRVWRDPETGKLMQQASPAAMMLLLVVIAARYLLRTYFGADPAANGRLDPTALLVTDALLTFAIGLIAFTRIELALRARSIDGA